MLKEIERTEHAITRHHAEHHPGEPILKVSNLSVEYQSGAALRDVSLQVARADRLAVLGPNGAGKSTLLKVIAGVLSPTRGTVEVFGENPDEHICIAYVPQRSQVDWNFPVRVQDVVMMGRIGKLGLLRRPARADREIVENALSVVNMTALASRQISELSGGQQQRMFIARALAQEAEIMLMDEPLTGLDAGSQEDIFRIFDTLRENRVTLLVALHDLKMAAERFDGVILLNHHLVGMGTAGEVFTPARLALAYGSDRFGAASGWAVLDDTCCGDGDHHD
jgi:manganese/iron transport system ATP-binding protein